MIRSFFILTNKGFTLIEKHYRGYLNRSIVDTFVDHLSRVNKPTELEPIIPTSKFYLFHILADELIFLCPVQADVPPLLVFEFMRRINSIFLDYYGGPLTEETVKSNFVSIYKLLEEVMDSGMPFTTYPNILKKMVPPPTLLDQLMIKEKKQELPEEIASSISWRQPVKHTNNEIFFDIVEQLDAVVDLNGMMIHGSVYGEVNVNCCLSGMPDLTLRWTNPRLIDDASFHPCVRYSRYEQDRVVSFIPPDGNFVLMRFRIYQPITPPVYCKPSITYSETGGKFSIMVGEKNLPTEKTVEDLVVTIPFPKCVCGVTLDASNGATNWDEITKTAKWGMSKLPKNKAPILTGSISFTPGAVPPSKSPTVLVSFRINTFSVSGLKVDSLALHNESYKPFKGVRNISKAGHFEVRC